MAIHLSDVQFFYPQAAAQQVLNIPNWSLAAGQHSFIHGPSGCGKSTLLGLLSGLLTATDGDINLLGQTMSLLSQRQRDRFRAKHIGYIFQQFNLIPYLSAMDNIKLASKFNRLDNALPVQQQSQYLLGTLNIPSSSWHKPCASLSIGQQQRVAIARALINKPQIIIADEPTSSLDSPNTEAFMQLLMSMAKEYQASLVFVSHDLSLAKHFDRVESFIDINQLQSL